MELHAGDVAIPRAVSGGLQSVESRYYKVFRALVAIPRAVSGGLQFADDLRRHNIPVASCNTASGIRRATIYMGKYGEKDSLDGCNTASGIRRATIPSAARDDSTSSIMLQYRERYQEGYNATVRGAKVIEMEVAIPRAVSGGLQYKRLQSRRNGI